MSESDVKAKICPLMSRVCAGKSCALWYEELDECGILALVHTGNYIGEQLEKHRKHDDKKGDKKGGDDAAAGLAGLFG